MQLFLSILESNQVCLQSGVFWTSKNILYNKAMIQEEVKKKKKSRFTEEKQKVSNQELPELGKLKMLPMDPAGFQIFLPFLKQNGLE